MSKAIYYIVGFIFGISCALSGYFMVRYGITVFFEKWFAIVALLLMIGTGIYVSVKRKRESAPK